MAMLAWRCACIKWRHGSNACCTGCCRGGAAGSHAPAKSSGQMGENSSNSRSSSSSRSRPTLPQGAWCVVSPKVYTPAGSPGAPSGCRARAAAAAAANSGCASSCRAALKNSDTAASVQGAPAWLGGGSRQRRQAVTKWFRSSRASVRPAVTVAIGPGEKHGGCPFEGGQARHQHAAAPSKGLRAPRPPRSSARKQQQAVHQLGQAPRSATGTRPPCTSQLQGCSRSAPVTPPRPPHHPRCPPVGVTTSRH